VTGKNVQKCGLFVHPDFPFLGASPDGLLLGEDAVLEVKCPYAGRNSKIVPGKLFPFIENKSDGSGIQIKRTHAYYYQIMGEMKLSKRSHCYFVIYTLIDGIIIKEILDEGFFKYEMLPALTKFYDENYCPYVASCLRKKFAFTPSLSMVC
jgi:predicted phage-related endonuclease